MKNLFKKFFNFKAKVITVGMLAVFPLAVLLLPAFVQAGVTATISDYVTEALGRLLLIIVNFLGSYVLLPLINLMVWIMGYNGFLSSRAVQIGWPLVRDISNMFFVVLLLVIAFSTILKISNYQYKNTLAKLLLMAVLVNFSKTIMGLLIDFGQVIMLTFVNAFRDAAASNLVHMFGIKDMLKINLAGGAINNWEILGTALLAVVLLVVAIGVMLAFVAVLLMRILYLWVLVILSPLAFLLSAFPGTKYASEFWSNFWKQLTTGIALAFFTWLALTVIAAGQINDTDQAAMLLGSGSSAGTAAQQQAVTGDTGVISEDIQWERLYVFIIGIAMLLLALQYAGQAGGFAGSAAGKISGKLSQYGAKAAKFATAPVWAPLLGAGMLAKYGAKRVGQTVERKILDISTKKELEGSRLRKGLKYFTKAGWEGFGKRGEELLKGSREMAMAYAQDEVNRLLTRGKVRTSHALNMAERHAKQTMEEYPVSGLEDMKFQFNNILDVADGREKDDRLRGLFMVASKQAWVDDLMSIGRVRKMLLTDEEKNRVGTRYLRAEAKNKGITDKAGQQSYIEEHKKDLQDEKGNWKTDWITDKVLKDYGKDTVITSRQKQGQFFKYIATSSQTGQLSQEGLNLIYSHEENAFSTGHLEDIGYVRAAEEDIKDESGKVIVKKGQLRLLDYTKQQDNGLTEADEMGITEVSKRDPRVIARAQRHSFGEVRGDGRLAYGDAYFGRLREMGGGSEAETHRITELPRTASNLSGGTAVKNPKIDVKVADKDIGIIETDISVLADVLARQIRINDRKFSGRAYSLNGGSFIIKKDTKDGKVGDVMAARDAFNKGNCDMIYRIIDEEDLDDKGRPKVKGTFGIDPVEGIVSILDKDLKVEEGSKSYSIKDFIEKNPFKLDEEVIKRFRQIKSSPGFEIPEGEENGNGPSGASPSTPPSSGGSSGGSGPAPTTPSSPAPEIKVELNNQEIVSKLEDIERRLATAQPNSPERSKAEADRTTLIKSQVNPKMNASIETVINRRQDVFGKENWIKEPASRVLFINLLRKELNAAFSRNPDMSKLMRKEVTRRFRSIGDDFSKLRNETISDEEMRSFLNEFHP